MQGLSNIVSGLRPNVLIQPRFVRILEVGLMIILVILIGKIITDYLSYSESMTNSLSESDASESGEVISNSIISAYTEPPKSILSLFGVSEDSLAVSRNNDIEMQETQLNLILRGIMVNQQSNQRIALIGVPGNVEEVYIIGDEVEGARIVRIEPGRVVLNHNGKDEALYLSIPKITVETSNPKRIGMNSSNRNGIRKINDTQRIVSQQSLRQQLNNLPSLLRQAKAVPHSENGDNLGFKVVEIQTGSLFEDLGLQKDDIIQTVNGTSVRSAEDALNAYRRLRTSKTFQLSLLRSGVPVSLNLSVQ